MSRETVAKSQSPARASARSALTKTITTTTKTTSSSSSALTGSSVFGSRAATAYTSAAASLSGADSSGVSSLGGRTTAALRGAGDYTDSASAEADLRRRSYLTTTTQVCVIGICVSVAVVCGAYDQVPVIGPITNPIFDFALLVTLQNTEIALNHDFHP